MNQGEDGNNNGKADHGSERTFTDKAWTRQSLLEELDSVTEEEIKAYADGLSAIKPGEVALEKPAPEDAIRAFVLARRYQEKGAAVAREVEQIAERIISEDGRGFFETLRNIGQSEEERDAKLFHKIHDSTISQLTVLEEIQDKMKVLRSLGWAFTEDSVGRVHEQGLSIRKDWKVVINVRPSIAGMIVEMVGGGPGFDALREKLKNTPIH